MSEQETPKFQMCVPSIGTELQLAQSWEFDLYSEYRNTAFIKKCGMEVSPEDRWRTKIVGQKTLPVGTILKVDRIYIRQGKAEFDSITFRIRKCSEKALEKGRFWAKLRDVNTMVCFPIGSDVTELAFGKAIQNFGAVGARVLDV